MEPQSLSWVPGDDHSDDDAICEPPQAGALIRRIGLVGNTQRTLNRCGAPWVGNDSKCTKSGALIRRLGSVIDPKQARGIRPLG